MPTEIRRLEVPGENKGSATSGKNPSTGRILQRYLGKRLGGALLLGLVLGGVFGVYRRGQDAMDISDPDRARGRRDEELSPLAAPRGRVMRRP